MTVAVAIAGLVVLLAAALAGLRRNGPPAVRWVAFAVALVVALGALGPRHSSFAAGPMAVARAELAGDAAPTRALAAAAAAGPRTVDLQLAWGGPWSAAGPAPAPLGAVPVLAQPPLPFEPGALQVTALGTAAAGRPLRLQVAIPELAEPVSGTLQVAGPQGELRPAPLLLAPGRAAEVDLLPPAAGEYRLAIELPLATARLQATGRFAVGPPPAVLCVEPSGTLAAALQAQGVAVVAASALPADWHEHGVLLLGTPLPLALQEALVPAVLDGLGLFVLGPACGTPGEPLADLLPVRRLPVAAAAPSGAGGEAVAPPPANPPPAAPPPPAAEPPTTPPRGNVPPGPIGAEPVEVDKRSIAMVLLVDRSGSMGTPLPGAGGATKMSFAKTSALRTAQALGPGDQVAIITFGQKDAARIELPLTEATETDRIRAGIDRLGHAPEQTYLLSGLRAAERVLDGHAAAVKHIVVLTDGEFMLSESIALRALANRLRTRSKVTLSLISIIDGQTDRGFLTEAQQLAADGGGEFLPLDDPRAVPTFVSAEVTRALQRVGREPRRQETAATGPVGAAPPPIAPPVPPPPPTTTPPTPPPAPAAPERLPVHAVAESPVLAPLPDGDWPSLGAALPTRAPFAAQVLLAAGREGWPLLAFQNRGLGRVGAFAADLGGAAAAEFRADPAFPARLAQWLEHVRPAASAASPQPVALAVAVTPPLPTPAEVAQLAAWAGSVPAAAANPPAAPAPPWRRQWRDEAPALALAALLGLVLLAVAERRGAAVPPPGAGTLPR